MPPNIRFSSSCLRFLQHLAATMLLVVAPPVLAAAQTPTDVPGEPESPIRLEWDPLPSLRIGDDVRIDLRLKLQGDLRAFSPEQPTDNGTFELHRRRVSIEGRLFEDIEFQIERELRERRVWRDVYVNFRAAGALQVRAGKFKMPFGLEETTPTMDLDFVYRTLGSDGLTPARDIGVMAHGRIGRLLEYEAGGFKEDGENARLTEPVFLLPGEEEAEGGRAIAARVVTTPFGRGGGSRPRLGVAVTSSTLPEGLNSLRGRTVFGSDFFPRVYVRGRRTRVGAEAEWNPGPVGLRGEYIRVGEDREGQGLGDVDLSEFIGRSWYATATWVMTGEDKANRIRPRRSLFQGGVGAVEIGTRLEILRFESANREGPAFRNPRADHVAMNEDRVWTSGVNWYVNRWIKIQANAIREAIEDEARTPLVGTRTFWSGVLRMQLVL